MADEAAMHASDAAASRQAAFNQDLSLFIGDFPMAARRGEVAPI
jgi:hypothetical protein